MSTLGPLLPEIPNINPQESGIEFFEELKKFKFIFNYQCNKVFLNHVDSFNGRHLLRYIATREYVVPTVIYDEIPDEVVPSLSGSSKTLVTAIGQDDLHKTQSNNENLNSDLSKPVVKQALDKLNDEEVENENETVSSKEVSLSLLDGIMSRKQVATLKSLPNIDLKKEFLRKILDKSQHDIFEVPPEEFNFKDICYKVSGTIKYCDQIESDAQRWLSEQVTDLKSFLPTLINCGVVIFDISRDPSQIEEARWALRAILCSIQYLEKKSVSCFQKITDVRKFILISSVMTWEGTERMKVKRKPVNEENLSIRKPHPLFKEHKYLEQEVLRAGRMYPNIFKTYVVASAIPYGFEEDRLNYLFDLGWRDSVNLPVLGDGHNVVPLIHIEDLAMIVFYCMTKIESSSSYLIASEKNSPTLLQITEIVSRGLTTGSISVHPVNQPLPLNISIHEDTYAMLISDILLEPNIHLMTLPWKHTATFLQNIPTIIDEYIEYRNLIPFKIILSGPPCTGKSKVSRRLAQLYDLKLITVEETVRNYIEYLSKLEFTGSMMEEETESELAGEDDFPGTPNFKNELEEIKYSMAINGGVPEDKILVRIMKKRLEEKDILNHGYIIDGWPETLAQAKAMFGPPDEDEELISPEISVEEDNGDHVSEDKEDFLGESESRQELATRNVNINPRYLIHLNANLDDILFEMLAGKEDLNRRNSSSIQLSSKMDQYKELENTYNRAFDYFDNFCFDMKIMILQTDEDPCPFFGKTIKKIMLSLGPPTNKGFLEKYLEEYKLIIKEEDDIKKIKMKAIAEDIEKMEVEYFRTACSFMDKWNYFKDTAIKEKSDCGDPLNSILPEDVFDVAVRALIEFKESSPEDHFEFLAEYFLKLYEEQKGRQELPSSTKDQSANFRKCIATILEYCDDNCLALLPQAVGVIQKYHRFSESKGIVLSPVACMDGIKKSNKLVRDSKELLNKVVVGHQSSTSLNSLKHLSLEKIAQLLNKTDHLWSDKVDQLKSNLITDDSLKNLLEQLRQLSCEIRYKLKKRGVEDFDCDSSIGNLGEWPHPTLEQECTADMWTQCPSQSASLEVEKNDSDREISATENELQKVFNKGGNEMDDESSLYGQNLLYERNLLTSNQSISD